MQERYSVTSDPGCGIRSWLSWCAVGLVLVSAATAAGAVVWRHAVGSNVLLAAIEVSVVVMAFATATAWPLVAVDRKWATRGPIVAGAILLGVACAFFLATALPFDGRLFHVSWLSVGHVVVMLLASTSAAALLGLLRPAPSPSTGGNVAFLALLAMAVSIFAWAFLPASEPLSQLWGGLFWGVFGTDDAAAILLATAFLAMLSSVPGRLSQIWQESLPLTLLAAGFLMGMRGEEVLAATWLPASVVLGAVLIAESLFAESEALPRRTAILRTLIGIGVVSTAAVVLLGYARLLEALSLLVFGALALLMILPATADRLAPLRPIAAAVAEASVTLFLAAGILLVAGASGALAAWYEIWPVNYGLMLALPIIAVVTRWWPLLPATALLAALTHPLLGAAGLSVAQASASIVLSAWSMRGLWPVLLGEQRSWAFVVARVLGLICALLIALSNEAMLQMQHGQRFW